MLRWLAVSLLCALPIVGQDKTCAEFYRIFELDDSSNDASKRLERMYAGNPLLGLAKATPMCWGVGGYSLVLGVLPNRMVYGSVKISEGTQGKITALAVHTTIAARIYGIDADGQTILNLMVAGIREDGAVQEKTIRGVKYQAGLIAEEMKLFVTIFQTR